MAHTVFELIIGGEVVNITVGDYFEVAEMAANIYGQQVEVIDVSRIPAGVGDAYREGAFYRAGVRLEPMPSEAEQIARMKEEQLDIAEAIVDLYERSI